jgi:hypothetical protein
MHRKVIFCPTLAVKSNSASAQTCFLLLWDFAFTMQYIPFWNVFTEIPVCLHNFTTSRKQPVALPFLFCSHTLRMPLDLNLSLCRLCCGSLSFHYRNALLRSNVIRRTGIGNWCVKIKLVPLSWQGSLLLCSAHERSSMFPLFRVSSAFVLKQNVSNVTTFRLPLDCWLTNI